MAGGRRIKRARNERGPGADDVGCIEGGKTVWRVMMAGWIGDVRKGKKVGRFGGGETAVLEWFRLEAGLFVLDL